MLRSDLLADPLSPAEMDEFVSALAASRGDADGALRLLPGELSARVRDLLGQGMRLSLELSKLSQRGVGIVMPNDIPERIRVAFDGRPDVFFAVGSTKLLEDERVPLAFTLAAFKGIAGDVVFVADRPFDELLRDEGVARALREGRAIVVADAFRRAANLLPDVAADAASSGQEVQGGPGRWVSVSGSRSQVEIPQCVQDSLNAIIDQGFGVLIGDSDKGVDKEVADYLRAPLYRHVVVYTISDRPRVSVEPEWGIKVIEADESLKPQERQMVKDRAMADAADWGLALFNPVEKNRYGALQVSSGTLRNTIQMLLSGKMVKFFYRYAGQIVSRNLKMLADLEDVIASYRVESLDDAEAAVILSSKGVAPDSVAAEVKHQKIESKYRALLRSEKKVTGSSATDSACYQEVLPLFDAV